MRLPHLFLTAALAPGCVSQRIDGYLDELADCSSSGAATSTSGTTAPADTTTSTTGSTSDTTTGTTAPPETGSSDTTAGPDSTGDPAPVCGDGVVDDVGPLPEECDDGNLDPEDGCSATCTRDIRVFVSSLVLKAGDVMSLHLADAKCANLIAQTGEPDYLKFRAWMSDSTTDARDRLELGRGRIVLVNGLVVADSWDALLAGQLQNPIDVTEKSETYHGGVWTGTRPDGTAVPDSTHCDDWSSSSAQKTAYYGYSDKMTAEWTLSAAFDNPIPCLLTFAMYCFQTR